MAELGTKDNPHSITPPVKDRIKGHYYIYNNEVRYFDGYNLFNKDKRKEYAYKWSSTHREHCNKNNQKWRQSEKGKATEMRYRASEHRKKLQKKVNQSKKVREQNKAYKQSEKGKKKRREKYKNNLSYRLRSLTRGRVLKALKAQNASKNERTMKYVNCSVAHLYYHIEQQFEPGMNWDNMGKDDDGSRTGWEVDHRRPCASFDLNDEEQKYMCFHWTNLQPMWGEENNKKQDYYDPKTFRYKWIDRETGWVGIPSYLMNKK